MKEDLLKIINHYGVINQLKHLQTEVFEFNEAVINHDLMSTNEYEILLTALLGGKEHIEEEFADVMVMMEQFKAYYELDNDRIMDVMKYKIKRQLGRIESEGK